MQKEVPMQSMVMTLVLALGLAAGACSKNKDGSGGGSAGPAGKTLAAFVAGDDYKALIAAATAGAAAVAETKCDDALAKGKETVALLLKLVPGYGAIGEAAESDKTLADRMGALNAVRATLEGSTAGYEEDKGTNTASIYCNQMGGDFQKLVALP